MNVLLQGQEEANITKSLNLAHQKVSSGQHLEHSTF